MYANKKIVNLPVNESFKLILRKEKRKSNKTKNKTQKYFRKIINVTLI